ncbi:hypothetical protein [Duganella phyllosphaerae]|uniref:Uncharacterized protein n=1 Tax=Duganella phyllosphaerae TaxID=762836 RepID=A0A1E7X7H5_9BURK|nr:hypothetical protein [Duganella phyllosphaerae]OFA09039.1 hypothetical protein DUPY_02810 [Duganella phyllosphaerae]
MFLLKTRVGTFVICNHSDGGCELTLDGEGLGKYQDQQEAADALADGSVFQPRNQDIDFDEIEAPRNLAEWEYIYS